MKGTNPSVVRVEDRVRPGSKEREREGATRRMHAVADGVAHEDVQGTRRSGTHEDRERER